MGVDWCVVSVCCNATADTEIYTYGHTLALHDALPICRGAPVEVLDASQTLEKTGTAAFTAWLLDRRAGTIQPLAYARGLARAAMAAGAVLHKIGRAHV